MQGWCSVNLFILGQVWIFFRSSMSRKQVSPCLLRGSLACIFSGLLIWMKSVIKSTWTKRVFALRFAIWTFFIKAMALLWKSLYACLEKFLCFLPLSNRAYVSAARCIGLFLLWSLWYHKIQMLTLLRASLLTVCVLSMPLFILVSCFMLYTSFSDWLL